MRKRTFQKGAISVFLTIILIPCIVVSGTFVDLSRVKLSKGVATSAADLSLNSLMTYYDVDLNDFYGMMASCQTIEQFYDEAGQYFLDSLYSQGLEADEIDSLVALWTSLVGDDSIYDLLDMEVQTETTDLIKEVDGSALGESSVIMKDQIVEFMKYRAPVEITKGIIDRLSKTGAKNSLEEADKNEELVDSKEEYAEDEAELLEALFYSYKYIKEYQDEKPSLTKLKNMSDRLGQYRDIYKEINTVMVSNFANTGKLTATFKRPTYNLKKYVSSYKFSTKGIYSRKETDESGSDKYYIDGEDMESLLSDLESKIETFNTKKSNVENKAGSLITTATGKGKNVANEIQWWVQAHNAVNDGGNSPIAQLSTAADNMLKSYAKVLAMHDCEPGEDLPLDWEQRYEQAISTVASIQDKYLKSSRVDNSDNYLKLVNKLETISSNNINSVKSGSYKLSNGKTIGSTVSEIKSKLTSDIDHLDACIKDLNTVIQGSVVLRVRSLDKVKSLVKEYHNSFTTWEGNASILKDETDMGREDYNDIHNIKSTKDDGQNPTEDLYIDIKEAEVVQLKNRLTNIRTQLNGMLDAINSVKYCGKKISTIGDFNAVKNAINSKIGTVPLVNSEIQAKADNLFSQQFQPSTTATIFTVNQSADYNPELTVSKPTLLKWMEKKFTKETDTLQKDLDENKKKVNEGKDKGNSENAEEEEKKNNENRVTGVSETNLYGGSYTGSEFPSGLDHKSSFALGSSIINGLSSAITDIIDMNITDARDSLYSTEYVMDMFSYATYEAEGKYNLYKEKNNKPPTESQYPYSSVSEAWNSDSLLDTYNKTLTNKMINSTNNVAYGAEVEYILYGDTNKKSVSAAYIDIFTIRYALNTISGFQNFWTANKNNTAKVIYGIASAVASATSGIIPIPLTKAVLILILTAAETGKDLDRFSKGQPVEVYKKEEDWRLSLNGWSAKEEKEEKTTTNGLFYSDYLYLFLYLGFESDSASEMYLRIGDVIQANMRKYTKSETYTLKNSRTYFKIDAEVRVKPLMLAMPISQGYANNPSKTSTDWCTFQIKEIRGYS